MPRPGEARSSEAGEPSISSALQTPLTSTSADLLLVIECLTGPSLCTFSGILRPGMHPRHVCTLDDLPVKTRWNLSEQEREEKAAKAARDKADKAASKEVERAEKRAKGAAAAEKRLSQGRIDISNEEVPRVSDTEDEGEGRPALRSGARRLGSAPPSSNGSVRCFPPAPCMLALEGQHVVVTLARCHRIMALMLFSPPHGACLRELGGQDTGMPVSSLVLMIIKHSCLPMHDHGLHADRFWS